MSLKEGPPLPGVKLIPFRPDGEPCAQGEAHAPHGSCPGLRPSDWVSTSCAVCTQEVWVPPIKTPILAVCSSACGHALLFASPPARMTFESLYLAVVKLMPTIGRERLAKMQRQVLDVAGAVLTREATIEQLLTLALIGMNEEGVTLDDARRLFEQEWADIAVARNRNREELN